MKVVRKVVQGSGLLYIRSTTESALDEMPGNAALALIERPSHIFEAYVNP